jgi:hypothetical protein
MGMAINQAGQQCCRSKIDDGYTFGSMRLHLGYRSNFLDLVLLNQNAGIRNVFLRSDI